MLSLDGRLTNLRILSVIEFQDFVLLLQMQFVSWTVHWGLASERLEYDWKGCHHKTVRENMQSLAKSRTVLHHR